ncbi:hypothetical protein HOA56_03975 [archaeon]|nr:hypothetical protein [archaeon]
MVNFLLIAGIVIAVLLIIVFFGSIILTAIVEFFTFIYHLFRKEDNSKGKQDYSIKQGKESK